MKGLDLGGIETRARLAISAEAFKELAARYHMPAGFVNSLLDHRYHAQFYGVRTEFDVEGNPEFYSMAYLKPLFPSPANDC
jgi:hypothetical protein